MDNQYTPSVTEAYMPEDGGWTTFRETPVLLLSFPKFDQLVQIDNRGYSYVWLYDEGMEGHVFCFKLNSGEERALLFKNDHAGKLLLEQEAQALFHIALTSTMLEEMDDDTPLLWLPNIEFTPRPTP
ncbi:hypothetical protein ACTWQL_19105 [Pseudalkalibacillus sp. R45]|uniref:hypothetical protein n=1 Tax=Pseudalkalibacillus sp. R45 TaxID=3457433 RepID=UPI003FCD2560